MRREAKEGEEGRYFVKEKKGGLCETRKKDKTDSSN